MLIHKEVKDRELYVYMNGKLIYKRWLDTGASKVFDVMAYDKYTLASIKNPEQQEKCEQVAVSALLKLKATADGGRRTGILSGYRPDHVFEYPENNGRLEAFMGDITWYNGLAIEPGEEKVVTVRFFVPSANRTISERGPEMANTRGPGLHWRGPRCRKRPRLWPAFRSITRH